MSKQSFGDKNVEGLHGPYLTPNFGGNKFETLNQTPNFELVTTKIW